MNAYKSCGPLFARVFLLINEYLGLINMPQWLTDEDRYHADRTSAGTYTTGPLNTQQVFVCECIIICVFALRHK